MDQCSPGFARHGSRMWPRSAILTLDYNPFLSSTTCQKKKKSLYFSEALCFFGLPCYAGSEVSKRFPWALARYQHFVSLPFPPGVRALCCPLFFFPALNAFQILCFSEPPNWLFVGKIVLLGLLLHAQDWSETLGKCGFTPSALSGLQNPPPDLSWLQTGFHAF